MNVHPTRENRGNVFWAMQMELEDENSSQVA